MNILVVDNDISIAEAIGEIIESWGHCFKISGTGNDALLRFRQNKFHLVLLDIFLPDCKGHELIPQFKEMWPDISVITITGYNSKELEWEVRQKGILYYMLKPFDMNELKVLLDHISKKKGRENQWQN